MWEDDGQDNQDADDVRGGPNGDVSLTEARAYFLELGALFSPSIQETHARSGPGFVYVNDRRVMRIPGQVLDETWELFWQDANRQLGTHFQDAEGEKLAGDDLARFAELSSVCARGLPPGLARAVLEGLGGLCRRLAQEGIAAWIET